MCLKQLDYPRLLNENMASYTKPEVHRIQSQQSYVQKIS